MSGCFSIIIIYIKRITSKLSESGFNSAVNAIQNTEHRVIEKSLKHNNTTERLNKRLHYIFPFC